MNTENAKQYYIKCLRDIGLSSEFLSLFFGDDSFSNELFESFFSQEKGYPWPPFFLPILKYRHGTDAYGIINHPFHPNRPPIFVRLLLEAGYVVEVARNEVQFIDLIGLESTINSQDDKIVIGPEVDFLLHSMNIESHSNEIIYSALSTEILEHGLSIGISSFSLDWPLSLYEYKDIGSYSGSFPGTFQTINLPSCKYEENFLLAAEILVSPPIRNIEKYSNIQSQWMSINSPGVKIPYARKIVEEIKTQSSIASDLLNAWLIASKEDNSNY